MGGGWVGGVKLKLKLNSAQLKLEFGLSLAIRQVKHLVENVVFITNYTLTTINTILTTNIFFYKTL